jgi:DinB superfamily
MASAKDVIRQTISMTDFVFDGYLKDLSDDDLLVTVTPGTNPIAWQVGHLILADRMMIEAVKPGASPTLPEDFEAAHGKETAAPNAFPKFCSKDDYVKAWKAQREATLAVIDGLADEQLDAPTGFEWAPTTYAMLNATGLHALGHLGQFVAIRRKLGKPIVF